MNSSAENSQPVNWNKGDYGYLFDAAKRQSVIADFQSGMRTPAIAEKYGCSRNTIVRVLEMAGLKLPPVGAERKHFFDETFFENVETEERAYWLGFIAADGTVSDKKWSLFIGLAACDRDHLEKFAAAIKTTSSIFNLTTRGDHYGQRESARIQIWSKKLVQQLAKLGITPRKSLTAEPWAAPPHLAHHYWRGVVDGDGWLYKRERRGCVEWTCGMCGSLAMAEGFRNFVKERLNVDANVRKSSNCDSIFVVTYCGTCLPQQVTKLLYEGATVSLDRKKVLAGELMSKELLPFKHANVTAEMLIELHLKLGSWAAVARRIGTSYSYICDIRHRLGMSRGQEKFANLTREQLKSLYAQLGKWEAVRIHLGIKDCSHFQEIRKQLGFSPLSG